MLEKETKVAIHVAVDRLGYNRRGKGKGGAGWYCKEMQKRDRSAWVWSVCTATVMLMGRYARTLRLCDLGLSLSWTRPGPVDVSI